MQNQNPKSFLMLKRAAGEILPATTMYDGLPRPTLHVFNGLGKPLYGKFSSAICLVSIVVVFAMISSTSAQTPTTHEGFTEPLKTVSVASPESGVLQTLSVREGDRVQQGDIIGVLDSQILVAALNAARQKLKSQGKINGARAAVKNKSHHLEQMQELLKREHASDNEVQQSQLEFDLANAALEATNDEMCVQRMEIKKIEAQLQRRIVRAPVGGVVLELPRQVGEAITAAESQVATIVALGQLRVRYFLTTDQASAMKQGDRVSVSFPDTQQQPTATVDFIAPVTDSKSGTVRVELLIDNRTSEFRSGIRCVLGGVRTARNNKSRLSRQEP